MRHSLHDQGVRKLEKSRGIPDYEKPERSLGVATLLSVA